MSQNIKKAETASWGSNYRNLHPTAKKKILVELKVEKAKKAAKIAAENNKWTWGQDSNGRLVGNAAISSVSSILVAYPVCHARAIANPTSYSDIEPPDKDTYAWRRWASNAYFSPSSSFESSSSESSSSESSSSSSGYLTKQPPTQRIDQYCPATISGVYGNGMYPDSEVVHQEEEDDGEMYL